MKYRPYPKYKPSGVEWLGDVPERWDVVRSDRMVETEKRQLSPEAFADIEVFHYSIPAVQELGTGTVENGQDIASAKQVITDPVILVSRLNPRKATICRAEPHEQLTLGSTEFVALKAKGGALRFLEYLVSSELFRQRLDSWVQSVTRSHQRARPEHIYRFWNAWPQEAEQFAIATFLDRQTARIDTLVAKKRALIDKLKEKRTALISRTVTRGLPPEAARAFGFNPCPKPRPSGIEWLGDIPEHWTVALLGRFFRLQRGFDIVGADEIEQGFPVISSGGFSGRTEFPMCKGPGVVIGRKGTLGTVHYSLSDYWPHDTTLWIKEFNGSHARFCYYYLIHLKLERLDNGAANPTLNRNYVHPIRIAFPPPPEQRAIADYLDRETAKIDRMVEKIEAAIERLEEYRIALITAAVTGKIDVRSVNQ